MGRSLVNRWALAVVALASSVRGEVLDVTAENLGTVMDGSSNVLLEFYAPWCGHCKKLAPEYEILGERFSQEKDGVTIAKVDCEAHAPLAGMFDVKGYPTLKWLPKGKTAPADAEVVKVPRTADGLGKFISEKTGIKLAKPPQAPSAVVDLTLDTFDSIVMDPTKNTLVEFFAPWCGHCKTLAPIYEKLGAIFADEKDVVVAKVDAVAEKELGQRFGVTGFPSLKYFPAGGGELEAYSGGRDLKSLMDFLNNKAGKSRTLEGGLSGGAGRLDALDAVLSSAAAASPASPSDIVKRLEEAIAAAAYPDGSDAAASAGHYARAAKKLVDKGKAYLGMEIERLEGLLRGSGVHAVTPAKKTLFMVRANILRSFVEFGYGEDGEEEKKGEAEEGQEASGATGEL